MRAQGDPEVVRGLQVSRAYFSVLGGTPLMGRTSRRAKMPPAPRA